jgi:hypothetical protein
MADALFVKVRAGILKNEIINNRRNSVAAKTTHAITG